MMKLCIFVGMSVGSYAGWYLTELAGLDFLLCFLGSGLGSLLGVYAGWKVALRYV